MLAVVVITIVGAPAAYAENGRDFSARYDITNVSPVGANQVSVTLSLRLQNHSGADIADAEVSLQDSVLAFKTLGVFPTHVSLANHSVANVSGTFLVPAPYVTQWRTGARPRVIVRFMSAQGRWSRRPVELLFMPGVGR